MRTKSLGLTALVITVLSLGCGGTTTTDPGEEPTTGGLTVTVAGLPSGQIAAVTVTGPGGFSQALTATQTLSGLAPGTYTVAAASVSGAQGTWAPGTASSSATVVAGSSTSATVTYAEEFGSLTVTVSGLPGGVDAAVTVEGGPGSVRSPVTETTTVDSLRTGELLDRSRDRKGRVGHVCPDQYEPARRDHGERDRRRDRDVRTRDHGRPRRHDHGPARRCRRGRDRVGRRLLLEAVTATTTLTVSPGEYTVAAATVVEGAVTYAPTPTSQSATVPADGSVEAIVAYVAQLGSLDLTVSGLPGGVDGAVTVSGPAGYETVFSATAQIDDLVPGEYTITATGVSIRVRLVCSHDDVAGRHRRRRHDRFGDRSTYALFQLSDWVQTVAAGGSHTCAPGLGRRRVLLGRGHVRTARGRRSVVQHDPVAVTGGLTFELLTAGANHTCGLTAAGVAYCWGIGAYTGDADASGVRAEPTLVAGGHTFARIESSTSHTCAIDTAGAAWCWGNNLRGALGNGTADFSAVPVEVSGGHVFEEIMAGWNMTCALDQAGDAYCWGYGWGGTAGFNPAGYVPRAFIGGGEGFAQFVRYGTTARRGRARLHLHRHHGRVLLRVRARRGWHRILLGSVERQRTVRERHHHAQRDPDRGTGGPLSYDRRRPVQRVRHHHRRRGLLLGRELRRTGRRRKPVRVRPHAKRGRRRLPLQQRVHSQRPYLRCNHQRAGSVLG